MVEERTLQGIGVSRGLAVAPIYSLAESVRQNRAPGSPEQERDALDRAIALATAALESLMASVSDDAADMLAFQVALLEDDDLLAPIHDAIDAGTPADRAWIQGLDREIASYKSDDPADEVFAARSSDLVDLRDRVARLLSDEGADHGLPAEPCIVLATDLAPSRFLEMDTGRIAGIALGAGSRTSHVSLLAQAKGVPLVVGLGALPAGCLTGEAVLDAATGRLILHPSSDTRAMAAAQARQMKAAEQRARRLAASPAVTGAGDPVTVLINVDHPSILDDAQASQCDGIGLTRTEFLFRQGAPSEQEQVETYHRLLRWAGGRPVTIRTLDAGGDKPMPGITLDGEANPFLGVRGIRLSLRAPDLLKVQLRALLRASTEGVLKVMLPMVTSPEEITAVRALMNQAEAELEREQTPFARPALGMMVEVPAAALSAEDFEVDFYSIGTNDLIQYATACARDNAEVAALARPDHPGVVHLIEAVVAAGRRRRVEVSVCGDMASEPRDLKVLLDAGVRVFSVAPATIGAIKAAIADYPGKDS